jgi:hypothetical protein
MRMELFPGWWRLEGMKNESGVVKNALRFSSLLTYRSHMQGTLHVSGWPAVQRYENFNNVTYRPVVLLVVLASVTATVLSTLALVYLEEKSVLIVRIASTFNILSSLAIAIFGCEIGDALVWVLGSIAFAISCCYALAGK